MKVPKELLDKCVEAGATFGPAPSFPSPEVEKPKKHKYNAVKTVVDGRTFASKKEAARYVTLKLAEQCGTISGLECHPAYEIIVCGVRIGKYTGDFRYTKDGATVIEDVKSKATKTTAYRLRKKLVEAIYGITITEV